MFIYWFSLIFTDLNKNNYGVPYISYVHICTDCYRSLLIVDIRSVIRRNKIIILLRPHHIFVLSHLYADNYFYSNFMEPQYIQFRNQIMFLSVKYICPSCSIFILGEAKRNENIKVTDVERVNRLLISPLTIFDWLTHFIWRGGCQGYSLIFYDVQRRHVTKRRNVMTQTFKTYPKKVLFQSFWTLLVVQN